MDTYIFRVWSYVCALKRPAVALNSFCTCGCTVLNEDPLQLRLLLLSSRRRWQDHRAQAEQASEQAREREKARKRATRTTIGAGRSGEQDPGKARMRRTLWPEHTLSSPPRGPRTAGGKEENRSSRSRCRGGVVTMAGAGVRGRGLREAAFSFFHSFFSSVA